MKISSIISTTVLLGILWLLVVLAVQYFSFLEPTNLSISNLNHTIQNWTIALGSFISPILQLALILVIVFAFIEKFGLSTTDANHQTLNLIGIAKNSNVQAFIAVAIIIAVVIGALADIDRIDVLKDLALVVVGFYFGRRKDEVAESKTDAK